MGPTQDDMARDLAADLALCDFFPLKECPFTEGSFGHSACAYWPIALRRALHAEAEVRRLQKMIDGLADRVSAQSDALSRRAERQPLCRGAEGMVNEGCPHG